MLWSETELRNPMSKEEPKKQWNSEEGRDTLLETITSVII